MKKIKKILIYTLILGITLTVWQIAFETGNTKVASKVSLSARIAGNIVSIESEISDFPGSTPPEFKVSKNADFTPKGAFNLARNAFAEVVGGTGGISLEIVNNTGDIIKAYLLNKLDDVLLVPDIVPGAYTIRLVEIAENGQDQKTLIEQDFTWGVLAINPNKSIYKTGETAKFAMAVLDERGEMVCDADVKLIIKNEKLKIEDSLSTDDGGIKVNQDVCSVKEYTLIPDYEAVYKLTTAGTYELELTAQTQNGKYTITDKIDVVDPELAEGFDIERITATRIYPLVNYPVVIAITPDVDFSGTVEEKVPSDFVVSYIHENDLKRVWDLDYKLNEDVKMILKPDNNCESSEQVSNFKFQSGCSQMLKWEVNWKAGKTYYIAYQMDVPDESPQFYLLGPLALKSETHNPKSETSSNEPKINVQNASGFDIGNSNSAIFKENRAWQLAIDDTLTLRPNAAGDETNWTPDTGSNYARVNEASADDDSSYVQRNSATAANDLYNIDNDTGGLLTGATINSVTVHARGRAVRSANGGASPTQPTLNLLVKPSGGSTDIQGDHSLSETYGNFSTTWTTNPSTSSAWTPSEIENLQVGIRSAQTSSANRTYTPRVTQVYVVVDYTPPTLISVSGTTNVASGTVAVALDGSLQGQTASISGGTWQINNITPPSSGANIIVFIDGAATADKSSAVMTYGGTGNVSEMVLNKHVLSIGAAENSTTTVTALINDYDYDNDTDIIFRASGSTLTVDPGAEFTDDKIDILSGDTLTVAGTETLASHDITINGTLTATGNAAINLTGTWDNNATFNKGTSTVTMTTESIEEYIDNTGATTHAFNNLTIAGDDYVALLSAITVDGILSVSGNFNQNSKDMDINGGRITTVSTGNVTCISCNDGTVTLSGDGTTNGIGGGGTVTVYNLTLDGSTNTTNAGSALIVINQLTINSGRTLAMGANNLTVGDSTTIEPYILNSGNLSQSSPATTTVRSSSSGASRVGGSGSTTFYNLTIAPTVSTSLNHLLGTGSGQVININGNFTIGNGTNTVSVAANTHNPTINVANDMTVNTNAYFISATTSNLNISNDLNNYGSFSGSGSIYLNFDFYNEGSFTAPEDGKDFTICGNFTNLDSFDSNEGTVTLCASSGTPTITSTGTILNNLALDSEGIGIIWTLQDNLTLAGNLLIDTDDTLNSGTDRQVSVAGNWTNNGTYTANNNTTVFNGASGTTQNIYGSTTFYNLTATTTAVRTIKFDNTGTQTVSNNLNLSGSTSCSSLLLLRSTSAGNQYTITHNTGATNTLSYLDLEDSSWTNAASATNSADSGNNSNITIDGACLGASSNEASVAYSFQRKTFYDATNAEHWLLFADGSEIEVKNSVDDGTTWTRESALPYNTNDFSVWYEKLGDTDYVFVAVASSNDIIVRRGVLGSSSVTWDTSPDVIAFDGTGSSDTYANPYISIDSSGFLWVLARHYNGSNYRLLAIRTSVAVGESISQANFNPTNVTFGTSDQISSSVASSNVYGNISPLTLGDMYTTFVTGTGTNNLKGCIYNNTASEWQDSLGNLCEGEGGASDSIDTVPEGMTKTLSAVSDDLNYNVHLLYVSDNTPDFIAYKKYESSTGEWDLSAVQIASGDSLHNPALSIETSNNDLVAFFIDGSGNIYYKTCDSSSALDYCSDAGDWGSQTQLMSASSANYLSSTYSGVCEVFAVWSEGSGQVTVDWDNISVGGDGGPFLAQNDFRFYVDEATTNLTNPWPPGTGDDLLENQAMTQLPASNTPLVQGDKLRIKMNYEVVAGACGGNLDVNSQRFSLQYAVAEDCTNATGWQFVGNVGESKDWVFFDNPSIASSSANINKLNSSTNGAEGLYTEGIPSPLNPNAVSTGESSEWDFPVENFSATENTTYCFRFVKDDGSLNASTFNLYRSDSFPKLTTAPGTDNLMRHGMIWQNNEKKGFFWSN
jgi:hypothetical protein